MKKTCEHNLTRKLYFQRGNKWITTNLSICEDCKKVLVNKQEELKNG